MSANFASRPDNTAAVHALFDLSTPVGSPFPSDRFTVADSAQNTGRRVALPMPLDCIANQSDCDDITVLNELDGFNQHPRVSIPFDGDIDLSTVTSNNIFLVEVPENADEPAVGTSCDSHDTEVETGARGTHDRGHEPSVGRLVGINQIVWDVATRTLHARADEALQEHARYVLVVTRGVLDTNGNRIGASRDFETYRRDLCQLGDPESVWYRRQLMRAQWAARRVGVRNQDIAAVSLFHTQSATYLARRIYDQVFAAPAPAPADFSIGPGGSRTVFSLNRISSVTFNRQLTTGPTLSPTAGFLGFLRFVPGAVDRIAFGRYESPEYRVHPGEYIPTFPTLTGVPIQQSTQTIYFNLYLPSGPMPAQGWPVAIVGHGSSLHKNFAQGTDTSYLAAHGVAWLMINTAGHGYGPLSTLRLELTDGTTVTVPAGGRSIDQNGDGQIAINEGFQADGIHTIRDQYDGYLQTAADLMQLVRVIQTGIDVDGDGQNDVDTSHITYWGWSLGSNYGMTFFAATPEVRAAVFSTIGSPTLEHRRLSPVARPNVGTMLAARTPSLLNDEYGLTSLDGVPVPAPLFNENQPLRNEPPVMNTVPGAIAIQQVLEWSAWAGRNGDQAAYAPLVRLRQLAGQTLRPVLIQFGRGDQRHQNPGTSELLRVAALEDRAWLYRHDLFYPTMPLEYQSLSIAKDAHAFHAALGQVPWRPVVIGAHEQASQFLASDGLITIIPTPAEYWELPIVLPDDLGYIR
jgi:hypothetical protein